MSFESERGMAVLQARAEQVFDLIEDRTNLMRFIHDEDSDELGLVYSGDWLLAVTLFLANIAMSPGLTTTQVESIRMTEAVLLSLWSTINDDTVEVEDDDPS